MAIRFLLASLLVAVCSLSPFSTSCAHEELTKSEEMPDFGDLRYAINYKDIDNQFKDFCNKAKITLLHWHGPFAGYNGLPERRKLTPIMREVQQTIASLHQKKIKVLLYIGPVFCYGDPVRRTGLFQFYDREWGNYEDILGPRPTNPLNWTQRTREKQAKAYEFSGHAGYYMCPNNEDLRQYVRGIMRLVIETGADGVFFDGPMFKGGMCFCDSCQEKFRRYMKQRFSDYELQNKFGLHAERIEPSERMTASWIQWRRFFAFSLYDFLREAKIYASTLKPDFIVTGNYCCWRADPNVTLQDSAEDLRVWTKAIDFGFVESMYESGPHTGEAGKVSYSFFYKYLSAASNGKPIALLKTSVKGKNGTAQKNLTKLSIAEAAANQGVWQFNNLGPFAQAAAIRYDAFLEKHSPLYKELRPVSEIALLTSPDQGYYGLSTSEMAISRFLADHHLLHQFLLDDDISERSLRQFRFVIVPEIAAMPDKTLEVLKEYVRSGGVAIAIGDVGVFDLNREKRKRNIFENARSNLKKVQKSHLGRGAIIHFPALHLPVDVDFKNISKEIRLSLDGLVQLISQGSESAPLLLSDGIDSSVELSLFGTGGEDERRLYVNMVNYGVDKIGHVDVKKDFSLLVRIPKGFKCAGVEVLTPDEDGDQMSGGNAPVISTRNSYNYVKIPVKELSIYNIAVIDLKKGP